MRVRSATGGVELIEEPVGWPRSGTRPARRAGTRSRARAGVRPSRDIDAVLALAAIRAPAARRLTLHGLDVGRGAGAIRTDAPRPPAAPTGAFEYPLTVPGRVRIRETGTSIRASLTRQVSRARTASEGRGRARRRSALALPLTVRGRRPGDRFRPLGAPGTRKLQDVLVDRKVPVARTRSGAGRGGRRGADRVGGRGRDCPRLPRHDARAPAW